jgi:hypothetical protein
MTTQEFKINGEELLGKVKELIHEGNIRRLTIKNDKGETVFEVPMIVGTIGVLLLPTLAAVGAVAALLTKCSIVVEKE